MRSLLALFTCFFGLNVFAAEKGNMELKLYGDFAIDVLERNGTISFDIYNKRSPMILYVANSKEEFDAATGIRTLSIDFANRPAATDKPLHFKTSVVNDSALKAVEVRLKKISQVLDPVQVWPEKKY